MTDRIATLTALYKIKNFIPYNKYFCLLARYLGFVNRKILIVDIELSLDNI